MALPFGRSGSDRVWLNSSLPQTLHIAHILMYIRGCMGLLHSLVFGSGLTGLLSFPLLLMAYWLVAIPGQIAAAFGIANERRWGYRLGVIAAAAPLCLRLLFSVLTLSFSLLVNNPLELLFDIALLVLLLHAQSRDHTSSWS